METLAELFEKINDKGQNRQLAQVRVCQEIFYAKAFDSSAKDFFTVKGGAALYELTDGKRGFTKDIDIDTIQYSISEEKIRQLFSLINTSALYPGIKLEIYGKMKELHHENYRGKNIEVRFVDTSGDIFSLSFDIGVHANTSAKPIDQYFKIGVSKDVLGVTLKIDPPCQMIAEKLVSFVKKGIASTRTKDIFDIYWLFKNVKIQKEELIVCINEIVVIRNKLASIDDAIARIVLVFSSPFFRSKIASIANWTGTGADEVINQVILELKKLV